jgi:hypothetical protein
MRKGVKLFHKKYKIAYRNEYFIGDEVEMAKDIRTMIDASIPNKHFKCKLCSFDTHVKSEYNEHLTREEHRFKGEEADEKFNQRKQVKQHIHGIVRKSKDMERKITSVKNNIDILMKKYIKK